MTFAEELRAAGASRTAVMHEFLLQHDPKEERIHAFVEGDDDPVFYAEPLRKYAGSRRTYFYNCKGKARVYQAFDDVVKRVGNYRHTLYFTDKDLSDLLDER